MVPTERAHTTGTDRVVIVAAGSCGVGREIARDLARRGYAIALAYLGDHTTAESTVARWAWLVVAG